jgi:large subunit ribosomal protein L35
MATRVAADMSQGIGAVRGTVSYPEAIYGADAFEYTADEMPAPVVPTFQPNTLLQRGTVYIAALAALTAAGALVFWRRAFAQQPAYLGPIDLDLPTEESGFSLPAFLAAAKNKLKTRKSVAKRYKVTGSGKVMRRAGMKGHMLEKKNSKRKNKLSGKVEIQSDKMSKNVKDMIH